MKDNLENFVTKNRDLFDDELPSAGLWDQIEDNLPYKRKRFSIHPMAFAASLVAVAVLSWIVSILTTPEIRRNAGGGLSENKLPAISTPVFNTDTVYITINNDNPKNQIATTNNDIEDQNVFNEITSYYTAEIEKRRSKLLSVSSGNEEIIGQIDEELAMIQAANDKSMNDLGDECNVGKVMENMIGNYRQSIDILDMMLEQLNEEFALTNPNGYEN